MTLNLNIEQLKREAYKEFYGRNTEQMPKLLADGRIPMSFAMLMNKRISDGDALTDWNTNYFDTSDLIAYSTGDKVKFILTVDANGNITETGKYLLGLINPEYSPKNGAIILTNIAYDGLKGAGIIEVKSKNLGELEKWLTLEQITEHKTWRILARHPDEVPKEFAERKDLLKDYANYVKSKTCYDTNMGVYPDINEASHAKLRAWSAYRLNWSHKSDADGRSNLGADNDLLVGLAPEASGAKNMAVPEKKIIAPTINDVLALGKNYVPEAAKADFEKAVKGLYKQ